MVFNKLLIIIRGIPGSGKSSLAETLSEMCDDATYTEADMFHVKHGVYEWKPENVKAAHEWCQDTVELNMSVGYSLVIVSNTFTTEKEMEPYFKMATKYGYNITTVISENRHGSMNVHNVPEQTLDKMRNRFDIKL